MNPVIRTLTIGAALLLASVQAAHAGAQHYRLASGDNPAGSNCSRVTSAVPAVGPYTAMRCTNAGGSFVINSTYPTDATAAGLTPRLRWLNPDASAANDYCLNVCIGVIKGGQNRNAIDYSQCGYTLHTGAAFPVFTQYNIIDTGMSPVTPGIFSAIIPNDTTGTPCTPSSCAGAEMSIRIIRDVVGSTCTGTNSSQNIDFQSVTLTYN